MNEIGEFATGGSWAATVVGSAAVAAFVAGVMTISAGFLQRRHDDRHRFDDLRRERYATFLREVDEFRRLVQSQRGVVDDPGWHPGDPVPFNVPSTDGLSHLAAEIGLLAPMGSSTGTAAKAAYEAMIELGAYAYDSTRPPPFIHNAASLQQYPEALTEAEAARDKFVRLAGRDLRGS